MRSFLIALIALSLTAADVVPVPAGTHITASFATETDKGPELLIDGRDDTFMQAVGGSAKPGQAVSVTLRFGKPLVNVAGIHTGAAEPHHNYYPKVIEFWGDLDGNGTCETKLGESRAFGPAATSAGTHRFDGRPPRLFALELRVTEQNIAGVNRAFTLSQIRLFGDPKAPPLSPR